MLKLQEEVLWHRKLKDNFVTEQRSHRVSFKLAELSRSHPLFIFTKKNQIVMSFWQLNTEQSSHHVIFTRAELSVLIFTRKEQIIFSCQIYICLLSNKKQNILLQIQITIIFLIILYSSDKMTKLHAICFCLYRSCFI